MRLLTVLAIASLALPALAQNQPEPTQGAYALPVTGGTGGYDFRFTPRSGVRYPEWLGKTITVDLRQIPCLQAIESVFRLAEANTVIEATTRTPVQLQNNYNARQGRTSTAVLNALNTRRVTLTRMMTVEEALQEIARQAQVDMEFYLLPTNNWRVVVTASAPPIANNLYIAGAPQQTVVSGDIAKALQQAQLDAAELNRSQAGANTGGGFGAGGGRGGFGGGAPGAAASRAVRSGEEPMTIISSAPIGNGTGRLPAPGISEKLVTVDLRKKSLKECLEAVLKPARLNYVLEGNFPTAPLYTFAFENLPLDLALDVLCANGKVGWSAELREGKPYIKVGRRYVPPKP